MEFFPRPVNFALRSAIRRIPDPLEQPTFSVWRSLLLVHESLERFYHQLSHGLILLRGKHTQAFKQCLRQAQRNIFVGRHGKECIRIYVKIETLPLALLKRFRGIHSLFIQRI